MKLAKPSIIYFGTPSFAVSPLRKLLDAKYDVKLVVTQPDRKAGRGKKLHAPEVKTFALSHGIEVLQPEKLNAMFLERLSALEADIFVVCAFGRILSKKLIKIPEKIINIHASILPEYRGAAPIHAAIKDGRKKTGVSIMKIVHELDAGDVLLTKEVEICTQDNLETLTHKLSSAGSDALITALEKIQNQEDVWTAQDHSASTYAHKIETGQAKIVWDMPQDKVFDFIRSYAPEPGAFTMINDEKVKIISSEKGEKKNDLIPGQILREKKRLSIATNDGWILVTSIQLPGKKIQGIKDFLNGYRKELNQCQ